MSKISERGVVDDLDRVERRQRKAREKMSLREALRDPDQRRVWRLLLKHVRPYRAALAAGLLLAVLASAASVGHVFVLEKVFEPILMGGIEVSPLRAATEFSARMQAADGAAGQALAVAAGVLAVGWQLQSRIGQLNLGVLAFLLLVVLEQFTKYQQKLINRTVALDMVRNVRSALFEKLLELSMRFFQKNPSGKLISRITNDLNNLGRVLVDVMVIYLTDVLTVIGLMGYLAWQGGLVTLAGLSIGFIAFLPVQALARRIRRKEHDNQKKMGGVFQSLSEVLGAQKVVKAFGAEDFERERFAALNADYTESRKRIVQLRARTGPFVEITGAIGVAVLVWWGGTRVIAGAWEPTGFMAIIFALGKVVSSVRRLGETGTKLQLGLASADRVATVLAQQTDVRERPGAVELRGVREGVAFDRVSFRYDPEHPVLQDVSFQLPVGRTLAIVGPTGSGKSTVGDLLVRFFDPDEGAIRIDGRDIRDVTLASLRQHIAIVAQDTILFRDTIAANIAYARPDAPREAIVAAARAAHAHEFIERLPKGYETLVGERGLTLSGGERQRIAIARALLRDAPILILDEATSALDSQSEAIVQEALDTLRRGRTTITIAHRLSTVKDADSTLVLADGRVVERGSHDELLVGGGLYAQAYAVQTRG